jgi:predicted RNase H-like HicB family nuclease
MLFTVLVHEDETGGYWGECLELPGCVSQGE